MGDCLLLRALITTGKKLEMIKRRTNKRTKNYRNNKGGRRRN